MYSPSDVILDLRSCARTCASTKWLFLRFPTRHIRHSFPSLMATTALWLKTRVSFLFFWLSHLCHDGTNDEGVNDAAYYRLENHHENSNGALVCDAPEAIADRGLGLNGEQKGCSEAAHLRDTRFVIFLVLQIPVQQRNQPKHTAKEKPGEDECQAEDNQHPPPADVHASGEDVCEVSLSLLTHINKLDVAVAIFFDKAAPALLPGVYLTFSIPKAIGNGHGCQLHAVLFRRHDAVAVGSHAAHHYCCGLRCFCFRKQSKFLQNPLEKQF